MKSGVRDIVGRRITGIIVKEASKTPRTQLFLVFDDGTYFEFYSTEDIQACGGVDQGGAAAAWRYMASVNRWPVFAAFEDPSVERPIVQDIMLGRLVAALGRQNRNELVSGLRQARAQGFGWRGLYAQALELRKAPAAPAPAIAELEEEVSGD